MDDVIFGIIYLGLIAGAMLVGGLIAAAGLWLLYRRQGGRRGLFAWLRRL